MKLFITIFFSLQSIILLAQTPINKEFKDTLKHKWAVKISPLSLIDLGHPNFTLGGEFMLNNNESVGLDASILIPITENNIASTGFIVRPSYRSYYKTSITGKKRKFVEANFFWKQQSKKFYEWVGLSPQNSVPAYYEYKNVTNVKNVVGIEFKQGIQKKSENRKWMFEFYFGIGIRAITYKIKSESKDLILRNNVGFPEDMFLFPLRDLNRTYWGISFPLGIKVAYLF